MDNNSLFERIRFRGEPQANPASIVTSGEARFTLLTGRLVRLEWAQEGRFEDRGSYAFPTRQGPEPAFRVERDGGWLVIHTDHLTLRYLTGSGAFNAENLSIRFHLDGEERVWQPGMPNPGNLRGTRRTLDVCVRDAALEEGLLSRDGWALFDDSHKVLFDPTDGWVAPRPDYPLQDWYFAAYGRDYKAALAEYARFGGAQPLIPRFVLGAWWSRFWAYSAQDLKDLVNEFAAHDLPLDVLVVDMDWHTPHSWTGYTWNREFFPDPDEFLSWVHSRGLRATFNLHPAEGVQPFEAIYPQFAAAMGQRVDPNAQGTAAPANPEALPGASVRTEAPAGIPFQITNKRFVKNYFELLHHPMEAQGVDFWWLDWQQGESSEMKGLDPLPWLNHLHYHDLTRGGKRGMLYSRWGGLGNHRYPIGFSGDTVVGWPALQFQPYFTATAANVLYGWWSHDIGGHMGGATEPELYARWVQFGALSPCLRLHATKDPQCERRPWLYPPEVFEAAKAAFHWRYRLIPYLYSQAAAAMESGLAVCRPMYYDDPQAEAAYVARNQYYLGDQMIAAPVVSPADLLTGLAAVDVWVPEGEWIDYQTKELLHGPDWRRLCADLQRMPMLVRAGGILPLAADFPTDPAEPAGPDWPDGAPSSLTSDRQPKDRLVLAVFPGAGGSTRLYEDDGVSLAYQAGEHEWTEIRTRMPSPERWEVQVAPVQGRCPVLPETRSYEIRLEGSRRPLDVQVDGQPVSTWQYDPDSLRTTIQVPARAKRQPLLVTALGDGPLSALGAGHNHKLLLADARRLLQAPDLPDDLDEAGLLAAALAAPAPLQRNALARLGGPFWQVQEFAAPEAAGQQLGRVIVGGPHGPHGGETYDLELRFKLEQAGQASEEHRVIRPGLQGDHIFPAPFAYRGPAGALCWEVETRLIWRGQELVSCYRSSPLFPTIHTWQVRFYASPGSAPTPAHVLEQVRSLDPDPAWQTFRQAPEDLTDLAQPLRVMLAREQPGQAAGAYLAATITSPDRRDAALLFQGGGEHEFYLNGQRLDGPVAESPHSAQPFNNFPWLGPTRLLAGLRLQPGANTLIVHTRPWPDQPGSWSFGAALASPSGEIFSDLAYGPTKKY